jgi:hypothetical protein
MSDDQLLIKQSVENNLINLNSVSGVGLGEKWVNGMPTGQTAILVFVQKKYTKGSVISKFSAEELIPTEIDGMPTDIIEVGRIVKQNLRALVRPIKPGYSCGHRQITTGTIGGIFLDADNEPVILSNNHVLANENRANLGDPIYQPGPSDTKGDLNFRNWPDPVAKLPYFATLKKFNKLVGDNNDHDSAIAKIHPKFISAGLIDQIYPIVNKTFNNFAEATVGTQVQKLGRTTGYTTGRVMATHASFTVGYDFGEARFNNCVVLSSMSSGGDSGSIIYDMSMNAVGLLFAGSTKVTVANPIIPVANYYGLKAWSVATQPSIELDDGRWTTATTSGTIVTGKDSIVVKSPANAYCFFQRSISAFKSIRVTANTGSDKGTTWGPGISVVWPNGILKVNLRHNGSFVGSLNGNELLGIGRVKPNTDYTLKISKTGTSYVGEVLENGKWFKVIEIPISVFQSAPLYLVVGKTNKNGYTGNDKKLGVTGECSFRDLDVQ